MSWFRLDDKAAFHSKMVTAGNEVCGAVWRAGAWCSEHNRSGFVPSAVALLIAPAKVWRRATDAGMVDVTDGGFRIHDFNDYNPTDVEAAALREKKQLAGRAGGLRSGAQRSKTEASASSTIEAPASARASTSDIPQTKQTRSRTHPVPVPIPESPLPPEGGLPDQPSANDIEAPPDDAEPKTSEQRYREAYESGIRRATNGPHTAHPKHQGAINRIAAGHCGGARGAALETAIAALAEDFARAVAGEERFWPGLTAEQCERWSGGGRPRKTGVGAAPTTDQNSPAAMRGRLARIS